jgi:hypothetical protein
MTLTDHKIEYPADVIRELSWIRSESEKGVALLADAEKKAVKLELDAELLEAKEFIKASGTVADRQAVSKIMTYEQRLDAEIARVEVNRIKTKLRQLSESLNGTQTAGKMIELQWKTAGVESR